MTLRPSHASGRSVAIPWRAPRSSDLASGGAAELPDYRPVPGSRQV